jgi:hypothetical protein
MRHEDAPGTISVNGAMSTLIALTIGEMPPIVNWTSHFPQKAFMSRAHVPILIGILLNFAGCAGGSQINSADGRTHAGKIDRNLASDTNTFHLRPEWAGPCKLAAGSVDVNLGNSPEAFVRAAYCQIEGSEPGAALIADWSTRLKSSPNLVRRVDVVRTFCQNAHRGNCALEYSNPWLNQALHTETCKKRSNWSDLFQ